jgi:hypothetical protein
MSADRWGGPGWLNKLSWFFDASVTVAGFSGEGKKRCFFFSRWVDYFHLASRSGTVA